MKYYRDSFIVAPFGNMGGDTIDPIIEKICEVGQATIGFIIQAENEFDLALKVTELQDTLESNFQISFPFVDRSKITEWTKHYDNS